MKKQSLRPPWPRDPRSNADPWGPGAVFPVTGVLVCYKRVFPLRRSWVKRMCVVGVLVALWASPAVADEIKKSSSCSYRIENGKESSIKECLVYDGVAEFEIVVRPGAPVLVRLDEPMRQMTPHPDDDPYLLIAASSSHKDVIYELRGDKLAKRHSTTITTESMVLTLRWRISDDSADSQVHISRGDRADKDEEVERRVAEQLKEWKDKYEQDYAALDARARRLAQKHLLSQVHKGVSSEDPDRRPTRDSFIVLRAERVVRIGDERFLRISVQNRDRPTLHIGTIRAWLERGKHREAIETIWMCDTTALRAGKRTPCTLALSLPEVPGKADRVRVRVDGRNKKRSVVLDGIDVR